MRSEWQPFLLKDFIDFNPKEKLPKGAVAKKVAMDKLTEFNRSIVGFEREPYKGGTKFRNRDTLLARITPCLENGKTAWVDILENEEVGYGSTEFIVLREKPGVSDSKFIYYLSISPQLRALAIQSMTGSSGRQRVQNDVLLNSEMILPPLPEQQAIAHILGTLDDKIELNRQMNETLEQMAQALFKSWFVDFDPVIDKALAAGHPIPEPLQKRAQLRQALPNDQKLLHARPELVEGFPDSFTFTEELGWIPKGWEVKPLDDIAMLGSAKRIFANEYQEQGIPFYRGKEVSKLSKGESFSPEIYISKDKFDEIKLKYPVPKQGDILITAVGTLGNVYLIRASDEFYFKDGNVIWINQYKTELNGLYLHGWLASSQTKHEIEKITIGSTQQALTIAGLSQIQLAIPTSPLVVAYQKIVGSYISKIDLNNASISRLAQIRDTLLPKLISGELRVPEAEQLIAEHV